jgi:hypothetical protein
MRTLHLVPGLLMMLGWAALCGAASRAFATAGAALRADTEFC